jgi:hypothetical protein
MFVLNPMAPTSVLKTGIIIHYVDYIETILHLVLDDIHTVKSIERKCTRGVQTDPPFVVALGVDIALQDSFGAVAVRHQLRTLAHGPVSAFCERATICNTTST